ncbi:MAG: hypothetical protein HYY16_00900 [Planctomycetes bacterium]|nr:hypothetical protein [Planctomycetota bacterium]
MIDIALACALACSQTPDDVAQRVHELVKRVEAGDLQTVDEGVVALVQLGPAALGAIKAELPTASPDTRYRLEGAIKQIERDLRRRRAMGIPSHITLAADREPLPDIVERLRRLGDVSIDAPDLPQDRVSVRLENSPFWLALDEVCKAHGGVMWRTRGPRIVIERRPYRNVPKAVHGNLVFFLEELFAYRSTQFANTWQYCSLQGRLAWVHAIRPQIATLAFDELEDDKGVVLTQGAPYTWSAGDHPDIDPLTLPLLHSHRVLPDEAAQRLAKCRGTVTVRYVLETRNLLSIPSPADARGQSREAGPVTVLVREVTVAGHDMTLRVDVRTRGDRIETAVAPSDFSILDGNGQSHPARGAQQGQSISRDRGESVTTTYFTLHFALPAKAEARSLDLSWAADVEEIVIPFDFKGLPFK